MKFGVLTFGYNTITSFSENLKKNGYYDTNLGDNAQSIAIRNLYRHLGFSDEQMVSINRELLPHYHGDDVILIMNGVFFRSSFPIPDSIKPIFIGFHAAEEVISEQAAFLRKHEPIGCRDDWTTSAVQKFGIKAYTTGCVTLTLPRRNQEPENKKLLIVYGRGAGRLPISSFKWIPDHLAENAELVYHRMHQNKFPMTDSMIEAAEQYEAALFSKYCNEATLVLTSLHHVATPCMAFGIPVIICRESNNVRFSTIEKLTRIHTPATLSEIDWAPAPVDITPLRSSLFEVVRAGVESALRH
ncbi:polysaccharide pyruvyl transferase family protein [Phyllobacterium sp. K27]